MYHSHHNRSQEVARGIGVKTIKPRQNFSHGSLLHTNGSLDLAIMGEGFFVLGNPFGREGEAQALTYTRDGSFQLDRLGNLVTTDGLPLLGEGQTVINVPFEDGDTILTEISVKNDGSIEATYGLDTMKVVGKINLADFVNEFGLQNIGSARFQETGESGAPTFNAQKKEL